MPIAKKIGLRLKKIREGYNQTVATFANSLGIGQSSLSKIENGKTAPSAKTIIAAYEKFQVNPLWLLTGEQQEEIKSPTALKIGMIADKLPEEIRQTYLSSMERDLLLQTMLEDQQLKKAGCE